MDNDGDDHQEMIWVVKKDLESMRGELKQYRLQEEIYISELRKKEETVEEGRTQYHHVQAENERLLGRSEALTSKVRILEAILEDTKIPSLLPLFEASNQAQSDCVDWFVESINYRAADLFEDELLEARNELLPWVGEELLEALVKRSESNDILSLALVRMTSLTIISTFLAVDQTSLRSARKKMLLKAFSTLFKVASWSLPTSEIRKTFEGKLEQLLSANEACNNANVSAVLLTNRMRTVRVPFGSVFDPESMVAIDGAGNPLPTVAQWSEIVGFSTRNVLVKVPRSAQANPITAPNLGFRTILPAQVFLKSTLLEVLSGSTTAQPSTLNVCDGRA